MSKNGLKLIDKITFGRHKGKTIKQIIEKDPQYLYWATENIPWFALSTSAQNKLPSKDELIRRKIPYGKAIRLRSGIIVGADDLSLRRMLDSGPRGEYAQLSMDSEFCDNDDSYE